MEDDDFANLIKKLQKNKEDTLEYEFDVKEASLKYLFFSSLKMKETFEK